GRITGGVYVWKPTDKSWRLLPGTELAGNNGIEISKDEREIYVAVSGTQSVVIYALAGDIKGGAVCRRGDRDRQSALHCDATFKSQQLDRDLALVVIHGDNAVQRAIARFQEDG